jgi:uncharacterized membrane protein (UPF0182 family)
VSGSNQNFNLTAWMVGQSDPGTYGKLEVYETPQGTYGPANADAEISANKTVSSDISLLDQKGSEVLLGETLMVPIADSMVYLRPMYVASVTNPQPNLQYVVAVLGKDVQIDSSLSAVLSDVLHATVSAPNGTGSTSTGTVPAAVAGYLSAAQTDYNNALAALKQQNLGQFQQDIAAMSEQIALAQQLLGATGTGRGSTTGTTTTTTVPHAKKASTTKQTSTTASSVPTSTEPRVSTQPRPRASPSTSTTSTTLASATPKT